MSLNADEDLGVLWGARNIGAVAGLDERQTLYMLENGHLPGRKIGDRWTSTRDELRRRLLGEEAA